MSIEGVAWDFPTREEIAELHRLELERAGAPPAVAQLDCVDRSVGAAISAALYTSEDDAADLVTAAAHLLVYLAKNHCFTDGNKRAAWFGLVHALALNDLRVVGSETEAAALVNGVASGEMTADDVRQWLCYPGRIQEFD